MITFRGVEEISRIGSDHICELSQCQVLITKIEFGISLKEQMDNIKHKKWLKSHPISLTIRIISCSILATSFNPISWISSAVWSSSSLSSYQYYCIIIILIIVIIIIINSAKTVTIFIIIITTIMYARAGTPCWWLCEKLNKPHSIHSLHLRLQSLPCLSSKL